MSRFPIRKVGKVLNGCKKLVQVEKRMCGELLGRGVHRDVYVLKQDPRYVVKIERDPSTGSFANVTEWRNYINNKEWKFLGDWLAPCELINETGQVLIQRRVSREGKTKKDYPKEIPCMFTDTKYINFGWIGDRFVCCDYSYLAYFSTTKSPWKKVRWWGVWNQFVKIKPNKK
jgi:hypothetical protein